MTANTVAIVNPAAGGGRAAARWPGIEAALREVCPDLVVEQTGARGEATAHCRRALAAGTRRVISVGGDGTHNEVLAGFVDEHGHNRYPQAELGLLGAGTGGDFLRHYVPGGFPEQLRVATGDTVRTVDYGLARFVDAQGSPQVRPFLNVASVGVSGLVGAFVEAAPAFLSSAPLTKYVLGSLRAIARYRNVEVEVRIDGGPPEILPLTVLAACNGRYFGGGMHVAPSAEPDDGHLDLIWAGGMGRAKLVVMLAKLLRGRHLGAAGVHHHRGTRVELRPRGERALFLELDGEQPGRMPGSFEIVADSLRLCSAPRQA